MPAQLFPSWATSTEPIPFSAPWFPEGTQLVTATHIPMFMKARAIQAGHGEGGTTVLIWGAEVGSWAPVPQGE